MRGARGGDTQSGESNREMSKKPIWFRDTSIILNGQQGDEATKEKRRRVVTLAALMKARRE
jgi:hypothetical protein